jgi:hypothetical protein
MKIDNNIKVSYRQHSDCGLTDIEIKGKGSVLSYELKKQLKEHTKTNSHLTIIVLTDSEEIKEFAHLIKQWFEEIGFNSIDIMFSTPIGEINRILVAWSMKKNRKIS